MSNYEFDTVVEFHGGELKLTVEFDYQPEEKRTFWNPGCRAEVEITSAKVRNKKIPDWLFNAIRDQLADNAFEYLDQLKEAYEADKAEYLIEQRRSRYA